MNKKEWKISDNEYARLVSYMGCGDFPNAKIIFFGIEEGTGGNGIQENVVARVNTFGEFENGTIISAFEPGNWNSGYWEPDAQKGGQKVREQLGLPPSLPYLKGFYNPLIARINLELEKPNKDHPDHWFRPYPDDNTASRIIKQRIGELYRKNSESTIGFALTDWRPLPRPTMNQWYDEYATVNEKLYSDAFDKPNSKTSYSDSFSNYSDDSEKRSKLLHKLISSFSIPIIVGLGKIPTKKNLLENIFPGIRFEPFKSEVFPDHPGLKGSIQLEGHCLTCFLLPFPDPSRAPWISKNGTEKPGTFALKYFGEVTREQIRPIISKYL